MDLHQPSGTDDGTDDGGTWIIICMARGPGSLLTAGDAGHRHREHGDPKPPCKATTLRQLPRSPEDISERRQDALIVETEPEGDFTEGRVVDHHIALGAFLQDRE